MVGSCPGSGAGWMTEAGHDRDPRQPPARRRPPPLWALWAIFPRQTAQSATLPPVSTVPWMLTTAEAAALAAVAPSTIKRWTDEGVLHAMRTVGGHRRFMREDVERLVLGGGRV